MVMWIIFSIINIAFIAFMAIKIIKNIWSGKVFKSKLEGIQNIKN